MDNESVSVLRLPAKEPGVAIWAAVELVAIRHTGSHACRFGVARDGRRSRRRVKPLELRVEGQKAAPRLRLPIARAHWTRFWTCAHAGWRTSVSSSRGHASLNRAPLGAGHATFIEASLEARSPRSRRGRQSKEDEYRSVEPNNVGGVQRADPATHFRLGDGGDLVHHQATRGAKPVARMRLDRKPEQRSFCRIACEWTHHKRIHALKTVVLHDDDGSRFSGIVACASNSPYFASPHP